MENPVKNFRSIYKSNTKRDIKKDSRIIFGGNTGKNTGSNSRKSLKEISGRPHDAAQ